MSQVMKSVIAYTRIAESWYAIYTTTKKINPLKSCSLDTLYMSWQHKNEHKTFKLCFRRQKFLFKAIPSFHLKKAGFLFCYFHIKMLLEK